MNEERFKIDFEKSKNVYSDKMELRDHIENTYSELHILMLGIAIVEIQTSSFRSLYFMTSDEDHALINYVLTQYDGQKKALVKKEIEALADVLVNNINTRIKLQPMFDKISEAIKMEIQIDEKQKNEIPSVQEHTDDTENA